MAPMHALSERQVQSRLSFTGPCSPLFTHIIKRVSPSIAALTKNARQRLQNISTNLPCSLPTVVACSEAELAVDTLSNDSEGDQRGEGAKWMP